MKLFDSHCHLTDGDFDIDRDFLIGDLSNFSVEGLINPASDLESSKKALALAESHENIWATVGLHPEEVEDFSPALLKELEDLAGHDKCLAIGEIGLDYYWRADNKSEQKKAFIAQLDLAGRLDLPVVVHSRDAFSDTLEILKDFSDLKIHFHCFDYDRRALEELMTFKDLVISIGGAVTFKNKENIREAAGMVPLDRLLLETDSPYLTPAPFRGLRNDPRRIFLVAQEIAGLRGMKVEKLAKATTNNTRSFYGL